MRLMVLVSLLLAQYGQYPGIYGDPRRTEPGMSKQPMPAFTGKLLDAGEKKLSLENLEGNVLEFSRTRKTAYFDGKKKIKAGDIRAGDRVTIETRKAPDGTLDAVVVRLEKQPAKEDQ